MVGGVRVVWWGGREEVVVVSLPMVAVGWWLVGDERWLLDCREVGPF